MSDLLHFVLSGRSITQKKGNGRKCNTSCSFDLEIFIDYVKGVEILLAKIDSLCVSCPLYWHCVFWIGAVLVLCHGKRTTKK